MTFSKTRHAMRFKTFYLLGLLGFLTFSNFLLAEVTQDDLRDFLRDYHFSIEKKAKGYSELAYAITQEKPAIAEVLVIRGANLADTFDDNKSTPLSLAIEKGYDTLVQRMIDRKANVNQVVEGIYDGCMPQAVNEAFPDRICGPDNYSLLEVAIKAKQPKIVAILLENGADPEYISKLRYRPIHLAVRHQQLESLHLLLKRGANTNVIDLWGYAPLHYVAFFPKEIDAVHYADVLLEWGANVNQKIEAPVGKFAPLHIAAFNGHVDLVQSLLRHSATVDLEDGQGCTPLWCSINSAHESRDIVRGLIQGGAQPNRLNRFKMVGYPPNLYFYTPLTLAIQKNKLEAAKILLENNAEPNQIDGNGETALVLAVNGENTAAIALLLGNGANPSTKNRLGDSPIDRAVEKKNVALLDLLIKGQVNLLSR